jgi:ubiquinone/menaquinone biosynthesis C-methylase UbiE
LNFLDEKTSGIFKAKRSRSSGYILGDSHQHYIKLKIHLLKKLLEERKHTFSTLRCIDVGCGAGDAEQHISATTSEIVGVDISNFMLSMAKKNVPSKLHLVRGDCGKLPFKKDTFDMSFSLSLFHHLSSQKRLKVLMEIIRVTKPGGLIINFEHNPFNPVTRFLVKKSIIDENAELLAPNELRALYKECGIRRIKMKYVVFFPEFLSPLCHLERFLYDFPIGGQYAVLGVKATEHSEVPTYIRGR